jgi:2,3-bisphosphoglycerate-independent phosphoglycerate mutase
MLLNKVILIILDGWGITNLSTNSAIYQADTHNLDKLINHYPYSNLSASGMDVGLPKGQMGNSEVGHLTIGAGRVLKQALVEINDAIDRKEVFSNKIISESFQYALQNHKKVHFIGLLSNGGIHSHIDHLKELCRTAIAYNLPNVFIHAFTDGRDAAEKSATSFISMLKECIKGSNIKIASLIGRYYAMDRDNRWERTKIAYDAMVYGIGKRSSNIEDEIKASYMDGITDEFLKPIISVDDNSSPIGKIENGDVVICFNFRKDRCRQITRALTQPGLVEHHMQPLSLRYSTFTNYDNAFSNVDVIFRIGDVNNTLGEVLSVNNKTQLRIAETEKYPHVTYFFSGGREMAFSGESRILCESPRVATYDLKPEMAAWEIKNNVLQELAAEKFDFICVNFANADMVGHTGNIKATIQACNTVDRCVGEIVSKAINHQYTIVVTADHGNAELMVTDNNEPCTTHTTNPVPFVLINSVYDKIIPYGKLADIAPTILNIMKIPVPKEMDGQSLIIS